MFLIKAAVAQCIENGIETLFHAWSTWEARDIGWDIVVKAEQGWISTAWPCILVAWPVSYASPCNIELVWGETKYIKDTKLEIVKILT